MSPQETFVRAYYAAAKAAGAHFGLNPVCILAQAAHESAWGTSYGARTRRNFFGVIATKQTSIYWDGEKSKSQASGLWFRVYKTAEDGFSDFARLIAARYPTCLAVSHDPAAYAKAIAASPYISEKNGDNRPTYAASLAKNAGTIAGLIKSLKL